MKLNKVDLFFHPRGSAKLVLGADDAKCIISIATERELVIVRVEGGIVHIGDVEGEQKELFEPRANCIWDGCDPPVSIVEMKSNNQLASIFIDSEKLIHNGFILTVASINGYYHNYI